MLIPRMVRSDVIARLESMPAVALLGPRQVGKTTLARSIADGRRAVYLDLEDERDRARLGDARDYLDRHEDDLLVLDEVQRLSDLFATLRGSIDRGRRGGRRAGRFLLLGSASGELLRQSGESLAGRISYLELGGIAAGEVEADQLDLAWVRGGFPDSLLALTDADSLRWRLDFVRTYLERDIPTLGPRVPAETLRRLWTMLSHEQGTPVNAARLAQSLGVTGRTVAQYIDLLVDLLLVRRLPPRHANVGKRLVKTPKLYVRDSGIVHALLGLVDHDAVLGHPVAGHSWEGFVVESLVAVAPPGTLASYYRTSAGAEVDLVLDLPGGDTWAIEIKRATVPRISRGFRTACVDLEPARAIVVHGGDDAFPLSDGVEAFGVRSLTGEIRKLSAL